MKNLKTINSFALKLWKKQTQTTTDTLATEHMNTTVTVCIAVSSSTRNRVVEIDEVIKIQLSVQSELRVETFTFTLMTDNEQNSYSKKLAAIVKALDLLLKVSYHKIVMLTRNKAAVLTLKHSQQQFRQEHICCIYKTVKELKRNRNSMSIQWILSHEKSKLLKLTKKKVKEVT